MVEIQKSLTFIQSKLNAPKNQKNSFGNYNYRSCEDILSAVKPLLTETKTTLTLSDEIVLVGNRYYVKATATLSDGTESIFTVAYARETQDKKGMDESQITGAASSYARKYALNGLFCIDDTKDADATNTHEKELKFPGKQRSNNPNPTPLSKERYNCTACGVEISDKVAKYSRDHYGDVFCMDCQKKADKIDTQG